MEVYLCRGKTVKTERKKSSDEERMGQVRIEVPEHKTSHIDYVLKKMHCLQNSLYGS